MSAERRRRRMRTSLRNCFWTVTLKIHFLLMAAIKTRRNETTPSGVTRQQPAGSEKRSAVARGRQCKCIVRVM
jgi:squalene cyclase